MTGSGSSSSGDRSALFHAATRFITAPDALTSSDYVEIRDALHRYLFSRFSTLSMEDIEDISAETVERVLAAARKHRVRPAGNPAGYFLRVAHNVAIQRIRRNREMPIPPWNLPEIAVSDDDAAAAALYRRADSAAVRSALFSAYIAKDLTVVRVVTYLLDELQETGTMPSNRKAADELELSHTGVAKARERFRKYLDQLVPAETPGQLVRRSPTV